MFTSLESKICAVIAFNHFVNWFFALAIISWLRWQYITKRPGYLSSTRNRARELNIRYNSGKLDGILLVTLLIACGAFALLYRLNSRQIGYSIVHLGLLVVWSLSATFTVTMVAQLRDENVFLRILSFTTCLFLVLAAKPLILQPGTYFLPLALTVLCCINIFYQLVKIYSDIIRIATAVAGGLMIWFFKTTIHSKALLGTSNHWSTALRYTIEIYTEFFALTLIIVVMFAAATTRN